MRRPPSYSDSYIVLSGGTQNHLEPLRITVPSLVTEEDVVADAASEPSVWPRRVAIFIFKGATHVLFISAFETAFYFLYVNKSEDAGILGTLNTYYKPLVADCGAWGNTTKGVIQQILADLDAPAIDVAGAAAAAARLSYNHGLLIWSSMYSVICVTICLATVGVVRWRRWPVPWRKIFAENLLFVIVLGLYEVFFFRTIIYNYDTLSTPELNRYLIDGFAQCAATP